MQLSFNEESLMLNVVWEEPEPGETAEQVRSYNIECNFTQDTATYTLKHTIDCETMEASLPITNAFSNSGYNCCVEAVFETYSSKACESLAAQNQVGVGTEGQQVLGLSCPQDRTVQIVAGVLTPLIIVLLVALMVVIVALVYTWQKVRNIGARDINWYVVQQLT